SVVSHVFFFLSFPRPPSSPLFPYTTLFRSCRQGDAVLVVVAVGVVAAGPAGLKTIGLGVDRRAKNRALDQGVASAVGGHQSRVRSEEHTSELQSRENLVCRLLLEKKKTRKL